MKYAEVVSGSEGTTMIVRITGGKNPFIEPLLLCLRMSTEIIQYM